VNSVAALLDCRTFPERRARAEAAKLAHREGFGPLLTAALVRTAGQRAAHGTPPVIAARAVVKHADAPVNGDAA
jgi:hypothetical protein